MKLILREEVENLGKGGEVVDVKPGYGRNYLLPRGLAVTANPKNVRELEHAMERAVVLADGRVIGEDDLPETVRAGPARTAPPVSVPGGTLSVKRAIRAVEEQLIRAALERTGGNRTRAAELLDLSYRALLYKIKDYGLG